VRIQLPPEHHLSIAPSEEWLVDDASRENPELVRLHGIYVRSVEHGIYLNVCGQLAGGHALTEEGLLDMLRDQQWASPPFDVWTSGSITAVGGTFETVGMGGEVVLEVFATDGVFLANLAGPGERMAIAAMLPAVRTLVQSLRFE